MRAAACVRCHSKRHHSPMSPGLFAPAHPAFSLAKLDRMAKAAPPASVIIALMQAERLMRLRVVIRSAVLGHR